LSAVLVETTQINFGQCVPSSCGDGDVFMNNKALLSPLNLKTDVVSSITKEDTENTDLPPKTIGFM
jgi:hypothetical protein